MIYWKRIRATKSLIQGNRGAKSQERSLAFRLAPPPRPLTFTTAIQFAAFEGFTEPPYRMRISPLRRQTVQPETPDNP